MVLTDGISVSLEGGEWKSIKAPVACANIRLKIPTENDRFHVVKSSQNKDIETIISLLSTKETIVRQTAIWILTDDADFNDLGRLRQKNKERVIKESRAYEAIRLIQDNGIDIKGKSIWKDIKRIRKVAIGNRGN